MWRRWASGAFTVVLLALLSLLVWNRRDDLAELTENPLQDVALIAVLVVVGHFVNSAEYWVLYRAQGLRRFGLIENWLVFTAGQLGNQLPGQIGSLFKFRYMKVVHDFGYVRSGSNYGANLVITFASSGIAGLLGLVITDAGGGDPSWVLYLAFGGLAVLSLALFLLPLPPLPFLPGRFASAWDGLRGGWDELRTQPAVGLAVLGLDLGKYVLVAVRFDLAFGLLGVDEPFWYFLVIAPAAGLAGAVAFTPGGLGFREGFVTGAAVGLGSELDDGLLAATVDRGVLLASALVFGSIGWIVSSRRMARATGGRPADGPPPPAGTTPPPPDASRSAGRAP